MTVISDTHRLISTLIERGFSATQAEAIVDAIQEIDLTATATKQDIADLKHSIEKLELRLTIKLGSMIGAGVALLAFLKYFG